MKLCDNPKCDYHLDIDDQRNRFTFLINDDYVHIERHMYKNISTDENMFLCDVCHAAVELVTGM